MNGLQRIAALGLMTALGTSCSPVAPSAAAPPRSLTAASPQVAPALDPSGDWELRWDRTFAGWLPPIFEGTLSLHRDGARWTGQLRFRQSSAKPVFESLRLDGDRIDIVFRAAMEKNVDAKIELSGWVREGRLIGEMRSGNVGWTPVGGRRIVLPRLTHTVVDHSLPSLDLGASGVDQVKLGALIHDATIEHSSAVVIVKDGKIGVEVYREDNGGSPIMAMSASKSIVSLAVGMLIADGKLELDTRMDALFPEWKGLGSKAAITVRQLLTHTSGLDPSRAHWSTESIREHALKAKLVFAPGTRFQYNNGAVDFLAVVFQQAAGVSLDAYLETRLFQKLDIVGASWMKDREGTPRGAGELLIRPVDLAKIGQLVLDGGTWRGERLLPAAWVEQSVDASQPFMASCGLLWWREGAFAQTLTEPVLAAWHDLGIEDTTLTSARALLGKKYRQSFDYRVAVEKAVGAAAFKKIGDAIAAGDHIPFSATVSDGPVQGFSARGWLGQHLVVLPHLRVVAVRMRKSESADHGAPGAENAERDSYPSFADDVAALF